MKPSNSDYLTWDAVVQRLPQAGFRLISLRYNSILWTAPDRFRLDPTHYHARFSISEMRPITVTTSLDAPEATHEIRVLVHPSDMENRLHVIYAQYIALSPTELLLEESP